MLQAERGNCIIGQDLDRNAHNSISIKETEKIVVELLKKVKSRRKMLRSYTKFTWFCLFFAGYVTNLFIKAVH